MNVWLSFVRIQICRTLSSTRTQSVMTREQTASALSGARTIFNGVNAETVFTAQTAPLPELSVGEILVKVKRREKKTNVSDFFSSKVRLASICMSDVHTITGQRIEPTPRFVVTFDRRKFRWVFCFQRSRSRGRRWNCRSSSTRKWIENRWSFDVFCCRLLWRMWILYERFKSKVCQTFQGKTTKKFSLSYLLSSFFSMATQN